MGLTLLTVKLMPESPDSDLESIKKKASELLENQGGKNISFEEKPIAFGLKAVFVRFSIPEEKGSEFVEPLLSSISNVSSVTIEDYRRAFG